MDYPFDFDPSTVQAIGGQWDQAMQNPQNQAAALSFGLQLLQPRQFGQSPLGAIGTAVGQAGAGARQVDEEQQKEIEARSRQDLRSAQSDLAGARADTATARSDTAGSRLALLEKEQENKNQRNLLGNTVRVQALFQAEKAKVAARNKDHELMRQPLEPLPTYGEFLAQNPHLAAMLEGTPSVAGAGGTASDPLEGRTATGPNGEKLTRRGGQWVDGQGRPVQVGGQ